MIPTIKQKLLQVVDRHEEINVLLSDPETISDQDNFRRLSIELSEIIPIVETFNLHQELDEELSETRSMLDDKDSSIRELAKDELPVLEQGMQDCSNKLQTLLLPKDPNDSRNIFLEIRAGTGGDEAALFSGDIIFFNDIHPFFVDDIGLADADSG